MAGKSRRVASRQAQLSRRRKKPQKGAADPLSTVTVPADVDGEHLETGAPQVVEPTPPSPSPAPVSARPAATPAAATQPTRAARVPDRIRGERPTTYNYIGAELRRILILATFVLVIIVVLGILL
jgi:hypothetical protein